MLIYRDMYFKGVEGFYYVVMFVFDDDVEVEVARFEVVGYLVVVLLWVLVNVVYIDTCFLFGCFFEMYGDMLFIWDVFVCWKTARDGWDGVIDLVC